MKRLILYFLLLAAWALSPALVLAVEEFNPHFIISDTEIQDWDCWTRNDVQKFLDEKGSYLRNFTAEDVSGTPRLAADIIYNAAQNYQINPKFLLVTLQKEQSLVTDDAPSQKQLDWATGYAVCDGCSLSDPDVQKHRGFGNQVDNAAGIIRWYYDNEDKSFVKKKDIPIRIDNTEVVPQSWATAFLYTYTPHLHGNQNFWRIWNAWFSQLYPNGSLLKSASSSEIWLIQNNQKRKFKNQTVLITRANPKMVVTVPDTELANYTTGPELSFPNYSILKSADGIYLLDYDALRPFESEETVRRLGYNPDEIIEVAAADLAGYSLGKTITASTTAPQGVIYQITDLKNTYYLLKDGALQPLLDAKVVATNYSRLKIQKHTKKELSQYQIIETPIAFADGSLLKATDSNTTYVIDSGKKRRIADNETFLALGYKQSNVVTVGLPALLNVPEGESLYLNSSLLSAKNKFLGDNEAEVLDLAGAKVPAYLIAEYPSGRIVAGKNIDEERPIASLTKIMTAYQALTEGVALTKSTAYNSKIHASYGNPLSLINGEKILNRDLLYAALVGSVNNAARMLAQAAVKNENDFIAKMNTTLENWGADGTRLSDVTGLSENNVSTPRDLLKIFTKALAVPDLKKVLSTTNYTFTEALNKNKISRHTLTHTNLLISRSGRSYRIAASKTGYTDEAGAVLIMLVENRKTKKQYVVISMGNSDYNHRFDEPNRLTEWAMAGKATIASTK